MTDLMQCEIVTRGKRIKVRTAKGRLSYPNIFTPGTQTNEDGTVKHRYGTSLLFPNGTDLSALEEAVKECAATRFGPDYMKKYPKFKLPFLKTAEYPSIGVDAALFPFLIRTSADPQYGRPGVVDAQNRPVSEDRADQVYAGRWARLTISVFPYDVKGNRGVSFGLNNVQVLADDEPLAGTRVSAETEFEAVAVSDSADSLFRGLDQQP